MALVQYREEFPSKKEAEEFRKAILESYHPCGYGTSLTVYAPKHLSNKWLVLGSRQTSCD